MILVQHRLALKEHKIKTNIQRYTLPRMIFKFISPKSDKKHIINNKEMKFDIFSFKKKKIFNSNK